MLLFQKLFVHLCIMGHTVKENLLRYLGKFCEKHYPGGGENLEGLEQGCNAGEL